MLGDQRHRLLEPVAAVSSSKLLLLDEIPESLPTPLNNACRRIAGQVLDRLGLAIVVAEDDAA
jgi:chromosome partitioning protein